LQPRWPAVAPPVTYGCRHGHQEVQPDARDGCRGTQALPVRRYRPARDRDRVRVRVRVRARVRVRVRLQLGFG
jgi:hypothetical protein